MSTHENVIPIKGPGIERTEEELKHWERTFSGKNMVEKEIKLQVRRSSNSQEIF